MPDYVNKALPMADEARDYLIRQFETAWTLTSFRLDGLTTKRVPVAPSARRITRASSP
jgi:hypothetical protein